MPNLLSTALVLAAYLLASAASSPLSAEEDPIFVRVDRPRVHFRESLPQKREREDIDRYADEDATFIVFDREQGEVEGYSGDWFLLQNYANGDRGWVAARYVYGINSADRRRLKLLGSDSSAKDSPVLQRTDSIVNIICGLIGIAAGVISMLTFKLRTRGQVKEQVETPSSSNVRTFPQAVPSVPLSVGPATQKDPSVYYGTAGGTAWIYRPKRRKP